LKKRKIPLSHLKTKLWIFLALAGFLIILSLLAPLLCPNDPFATSAKVMNQAPCKEFPMGTDRYGRCICSRVLMGARTSIFSAVSLVMITFVAGTVLGLIAGWFEGVADSLIMRLADVMLAMGITGWTIYARLARAQVLSLKKEPYVQAAKLSGCNAFTIMVKTLLPNMLGPLIVNATTQIGVMMIGIAGLSFLGIGVTEPQAEWGSMINLSRSYVQLAPWAVFAPAAATVLTVMIFNYLGDCLRDYLEVGGKE